MHFDFEQSLVAALLAVSTSFLAVTAYFIKDLHAEFKALKNDHQETKDRVLVLETKDTFE